MATLLIYPQYVHSLTLSLSQSISLSVWFNIYKLEAFNRGKPRDNYLVRVKLSSSLHSTRLTRQIESKSARWITLNSRLVNDLWASPFIFAVRFNSKSPRLHHGAGDGNTETVRKIPDSFKSRLHLLLVDPSSSRLAGHLLIIARKWIIKNDFFEDY